MSKAGLKRVFSDEELMAFADGEADAVTAMAIEQAVDSEPDVAARVEMFRTTARMAMEAFPLPQRDQTAAKLEELIKSRLEAAPQQAGTNVVTFPARKTLRQTYQPMALAASVAALVAGFAGYLAGQLSSGVLPPGPGQIAGLETVLDRSPSGTQVDLTAAKVEVIATFQNARGDVCREYEVVRPNQSDFVSIACREDKKWQVVFFAGTPEVHNGYEPASGRAAVDAYLEATGAGAPVTGQDEEMMLAR